MAEIEKFEIGKNYPATVTKVVEYGAFASLAPGLEGLIHSSEMSHTKKNMHPGKVLSTSQTIKVQILDKDLEKRRISLSYKNTLPNPWKEFMKKHKKDDVIEGTIKNDSLAQVIANLQAQITALQNQVIQLEAK